MEGCKHLADKYRWARNLKRVRDINEAVERGENVVFVKREINPEFEKTMYVFRNIKTGELAEDYARSTFHQYGRTYEYPEEEWELLHKYTQYAADRGINDHWRAYILPADAEIGEYFYIDNVIQDIKLTDFWGPVLASDAVGVWDGKDLKIDHDSYDIPVMIG